MATSKLSLCAISTATFSRAAGPTMAQPKSINISSRSMEIAASSSTTSTRSPFNRSSFIKIPARAIGQSDDARNDPPSVPSRAAAFCQAVRGPNGARRLRNCAGALVLPHRRRPLVYIREADYRASAGRRNGAPAAGLTRRAPMQKEGSSDDPKSIAPCFPHPVHGGAGALLRRLFSVRPEPRQGGGRLEDRYRRRAPRPHGADRARKGRRSGREPPSARADQDRAHGARLRRDRPLSRVHRQRRLLLQQGGRSGLEAGPVRLRSRQEARRGGEQARLARPGV